MLNFEATCRISTQQQKMEMKETGNYDHLDQSRFNNAEKKRRLTSIQVQLLEKTFEVENKLESERKIQLARDLGLQPRQVAIWFQNRRARWKSKQLEKDYDALKSKHEDLKNNHARLVQEKEDLVSEIQSLKDKLYRGVSMKQDRVYGDFPMITGEKKPKFPVTEEICLANNDLFDQNSPRCTAVGTAAGDCQQQYHVVQLEPADSTNMVETNSSNLSGANDNEGEECGQLPKHGSSDFGITTIHLEDEAEQQQLDDDDLWLWNY